LFTPEERERTAKSVSGLLEGDDRIDAVLVVGSLASASADRWSDIDLVAVVSDDAEHAAAANEWVRRIYDQLPVLHHFATAFGETYVRGFLLENLLELDLAFTPQSQLAVWGPAKVAFDRSGRSAAASHTPVTWAPPAPEWASEAGFAWHDVTHACAAVRRRRPWQALWYLERVRNRTLGLAQERRGWDAGFFDHVDDLPVGELAPLEGSLVEALEPEVLLNAIEAATGAFLEELRRGDKTLANRLEVPLLEFVGLPP
jgi:predicted nucleotidyltransferase